jgi:hypothetical protein
MVKSCIKAPSHLQQSRSSSVGIVTGYGLNNRGIGLQFPAEASDFYVLHSVKTGSGTHPASYPMGIGGSFTGGKAARALS